VIPTRAGTIDRSKPEVRAEAGEEQFMLWRRGFRVRPPLGEPDDDPRYAALPPDARPRGESLHDVLVRLLPYWYDTIIPDLYRQDCVLVVSHGNTLPRWSSTMAGDRAKVPENR
jgi:2,3-bisphosphoglycerate-dependent phosphoglycerate mutase